MQPTPPCPAPTCEWWMQASALLLHWGNYHWARNLWVLIIYLFSSPLCCLLCFQGSAQTRQWECFLVFGNFSLFKTPFLGWSSVPSSFVSFFVFYIFYFTILYWFCHTLTWIRYADDTSLIAESEEELKSLFKKVKEEELRWQRNRTGRPLSPQQIHQKNI